MLQSPVRTCTYPTLPFADTSPGVTGARAQAPGLGDSEELRGRNGELGRWEQQQEGHGNRQEQRQQKERRLRENYSFPLWPLLAFSFHLAQVSLKTCSPATSLDGSQSKNRKWEGEDCRSLSGSRFPVGGSQVPHRREPRFLASWQPLGIAHSRVPSALFTLHSSPLSLPTSPYHHVHPLHHGGNQGPESVTARTPFLCPQRLKSFLYPRCHLLLNPSQHGGLTE